MLSVSYISRESWVVSLSLRSPTMCATNPVHRIDGPLFVFVSLHYLIIIIMQLYMKVLNVQNARRVHSVECVSKINTILSINSIVMR